MRRLLLMLFVALPARADDKPVSFVRDVRPILAKNCFGCHGPDEKARKAKLRLDVEESAKGVIVPGDPDASDLIKRVTAEGDDRMPPPKAGNALPPEEAEISTQWLTRAGNWGRHWASARPTRP